MIMCIHAGEYVLDISIDAYIMDCLHLMLRIIPLLFDLFIRAVRTLIERGYRGKTIYVCVCVCARARLFLVLLLMAGVRPAGYQVCVCVSVCACMLLRECVCVCVCILLCCRRTAFHSRVEDNWNEPHRSAIYEGL